MNHSHLHNPKYVGPGMWFTIHTLAAEAKTEKDKQDVIKHIRTLNNRFPCADCKVHFSNYLSLHPPEETIKQSPESLFAWTINFHNSVNFRLKKPQFSYEESKSIYMENDIFCTKKCDEDEKEIEEKNINSTIVSKSNDNKKKTNVKLVPFDIPLFLR
jgi:hypothetical protein